MNYQKDTGRTKQQFLKEIYQLRSKIAVLEKSEYKRKQTEKELHQSLEHEQSLANIVRNAPMGIAFGYPNGRLENCNAAFSELTGYSLDELQSVNWSKTLTPDSWLEPEIKELEKLTPTNNRIHYEKEYIRKDGKVIPVELVVTAKFDEKGNMLHYIGFVIDITERQQAEKLLKESERRLKESQQIARMGQWELDIVNNHLYWSDGIYNLFEIDPNKFAASYQGFLDTIHPEDRDMVNAAYTESVKSKIPYNIMHRLLLKNKKVKYVIEICRTEYDENGKPLRSIGTVQDITELKNIEEELKKHREHLEELIEERTKEIVEKNEKLERFNKLFVDRELRIKELKNKIKEFEKK